MDDKQSRKLNAAVAGQTVMDDVDNVGIWTGKTAVETKKTELDNSIIRIGEIDDGINDTTGNAVSKGAAKDKAAKTAWQMAKALSGFAEDTNNDILKKEIAFEFTDLRFVKDATAIDRWQLVHDRANTHVMALNTGGYGVNAAMVTQAQADIDAFTGWRGKPRAAIVDKKAQNKALVEEFKNLDKIIESLEERVVQFAVSNTEFYNAVLDAFDEDGSGVRHIAIRMVYVDATTQIRLRGVQTKLVEKNLSRKSSDRGVTPFTQQEAPQANYSVESKLPGYQDVLTNNIGVETGKLKKIVVTMTKI
jgi:hypothetical protein